MIELLVAIAIIGTLAAVLIFQLNPQGQINKAKDAQRKQEIGQITQAMEAYYNDHNAYPLSIPFGEAWINTTTKTTYMVKVPKGDECNTGTETGCYIYEKQNSSNPQWGIVFAKLSLTNSNQVTSSVCSLKSLDVTTPCLPQNYNSTWACAVAGKVSCPQVVAIALPDTNIASEGTSDTRPTRTQVTPTPTPLATPTPQIARCAVRPDVTLTKTYSNNMVACNIQPYTQYTHSAGLCNTDSHVCTINEYLSYGGKISPPGANGHYYWLQSNARYVSSCGTIDTLGIAPSNTGEKFVAGSGESYLNACSFHRGYYSLTSSSNYQRGSMCCTGSSPANLPIVDPTSTPAQ